MTGRGYGRVVFDISTSMRWIGPPHGIVRVERQLALWALANLPNVVLAFFDPARQTYRTVRDAGRFLTGAATVNCTGLPEAAARRSDRGPPKATPALRWVAYPRYTTLMALERTRLTARNAGLARLANRLQRALMSAKYRRLMVHGDGRRRGLVPYDMAVGETVELQPDDVVVCAGVGWAYTNIDALRDLKSRARFRLVLLCHDLIPVKFPGFSVPAATECFRTYIDKALLVADRIVVNSRTTEADCRDYCAQHDIAHGDIVVVPFGFDFRPAHAGPAAELPPGIAPGRFALLVSAIQPHKGHRMMNRVWLRLLAEGTPQAHGFKLLFVGRPGLGSEDLVAQIGADPRLAGNLLMLSEADDDLLSALYDAAAFCVYPSEYEGYGLPVIEAFAHGKAVLASTGGAVPELAEGWAPCLDPADEEAWYRTMKSWIEDREARRPFEDAIRARFKHPTWSQAAAQFFARIGPDQPPRCSAARSSEQ